MPSLPCGRRGFPAHAGMDPERRPVVAVEASPRTRGWTQALFAERGRPVDRKGFPAHAGMDPGKTSAYPHASGERLPRARGDGPCPDRDLRRSPRTRGWTPSQQAFRPPTGFPAHAGMDPMPSSTFAQLDAAYGASPRTRGWTPVSESVVAPNAWASPRTRGWTL